MSEVIPETSLSDFLTRWKPDDLIVESRKTVRDALQQKLFQLHQHKYSSAKVPLCYWPLGTRLQNTDFEIPGRLTESGPEKQTLVLNDIVTVSIDAAKNAISMNKSPWTLGYAMTIQSSQGLTISDTTIWIVDDRIEWSNLVILAVSRVRKMDQLKRFVIDTSTRTVVDTQNYQIKKLSNYRQLDKKIRANLTLTKNLLLRSTTAE